PITVRVNAVTLHRDDGSGFFKLLGSNELSVEQSTLFMEFLDYTNYVYANFVEQADTTYINCGYTGTEFFPDLKVRIKNNVIPISDDYYWDYLNGWVNPYSENYTGVNPGIFTAAGFYLHPLDEIIHNSPNYPKAINTYYPHNGDLFDQAIADNGETEGEHFAISHGPSSTDLERSSRTMVPERYLKYIYHKYQAQIECGTTWEVTRNWFINDSRGAVAHELGHSFSLSHTPSNCWNNLMRSGSGTASYDRRNFLTPTQIRTVHDKLTNTNLIQFVTEDSYYDVGLRITQNQTWTGKRRIYSDLIIENGANLILKKDLIMSPQSVIYIRNGGTLTLDGGLILSADGENWGGLFKNPTGNFVITANTDSTELYGNEYFVVTTNSTNKTVCGVGGVLGKESNEELINIYPNPSSGMINFELLNADYVGGTITIMNQMNQQVFSKTISQQKETCNLSNLQKGIYTVVINKGNQIFSRQIIIK